MTTLAFAGAGAITAVHALAARAAHDVSVTRVASRSWDRAVERAKEVGAEPCTYDELPAGADVVLVATPPAHHAEAVLHALGGGASVIVEKPLVTTLADADRLVEAAAQYPGRIGYAENLAFAPIVRAARARVGELGSLHHLQVRALQGRPEWGDFLTDSWGGGALFDLGAHPVGLALLLAAPARPVQVVAHLEGAADIAADEFADVTVTFDSGLQAHITVSWRERGAAIWDLQAASATGALRLELLPTPGLEVNGEDVALPPMRGDLSSPQLERMGYLGQLESFIADFAAGRQPEMDAAFGREVLDVICGASVSAANNGRPRPLPFQGRRDRNPRELWLD